MNGADLNFHIGDKVVYPNHGVGVIEQISSRSIGATVEKFYLLNIKASSLKVMVPCNNVGSVGIRRVVRNGEVQKILDFLSIAENLSTADWKDRFKENSDRMRTGSLFEVAGVLKSLIALHQAKPLSFREKKMLERARYLLVSELAMSRNCEETKIEELLALNLSQVQTPLPRSQRIPGLIRSFRSRISRLVFPKRSEGSRFRRPAPRTLILGGAAFPALR
jgi:CarD family transcriptional regulator